MSTVAVSGGLRSTLNPNAPLFIPASLQQVEEFSPEWYELVKTSAWFREYWFSQHQDLEAFYGASNENEDVVGMLPESIELGMEDEFSDIAGFDDGTFDQFAYVEDSVSSPPGMNKMRSDVQSDTYALLRNLGLQTPNEDELRNLMEASKCREKPAPTVSPKPSPCRIIQQPR